MTDLDPSRQERRDDRELASRLDRLQERLWVTEAQNGQTDAFHQLVQRYEKPLLYYLSRILRNREDALEALQEVWIAVFKGLKHLRAPEAFRVWVYQLARARIADALRKSQRAQELAEALEKEPAVEFVWADEEWGTAEEVHVALGKLPAAHAEVITLRFLEDLTIEEIADTLGCSPGTVKSRLHYARVALKKQMKNQP